MRKIIVLLGIVGVLLAGCGSSSGYGSGAKSSSSTSGAGSTSAAGSGASAAPVALPGTTNDAKTGDATGGDVEAELDDFYFGPAFVKATPGEKVTLHLSNEGKAPHTFTSTALGIDQELQPDQKMDVTVTLPQSGATEFCRFHQSQGMQGAFFFNAGGAVTNLQGGAGSSSSSSSTGGNPYN